MSQYWRSRLLGIASAAAALAFMGTAHAEDCPKNLDPYAVPAAASEAAALACERTGKDLSKPQTVTAYPAFLGARLLNQQADRGGSNAQDKYCRALELLARAKQVTAPATNGYQRKLNLAAVMRTGVPLEELHSAVGLRQIGGQCAGIAVPNFETAARSTPEPAVNDGYYRESLYYRAVALKNAGRSEDEINIQRDLRAVAAGPAGALRENAVALIVFRPGEGGDCKDAIPNMSPAELAGKMLAWNDNTRRDYRCLGLGYLAQQDYSSAASAFDSMRNRNAESFGLSGQARVKARDIRGIQDLVEAERREPSAERGLDLAWAHTVFQQFGLAEAQYDRLASRQNLTAADRTTVIETWIAFRREVNDPALEAAKPVRSLINQASALGGASPYVQLQQYQLALPSSAEIIRLQAQLKVAYPNGSAEYLNDSNFLLALIALRDGSPDRTLTLAGSVGGGDRQRSLQCLAYMKTDLRAAEGYCAPGGSAESLLLAGMYKTARARLLPVGQREMPLKEAVSLLDNAAAQRDTAQPPSFAALVSGGPAEDPLATDQLAKSARALAKSCLGGDEVAQVSRSAFQRAQAFLERQGIRCN